jgi:hypothetical protein
MRKDTTRITVDAFVTHRTLGPGLFGATINGPRIAKSEFDTENETIKTTAAPLEERLGALWDNTDGKTDAERAIKLLENYSETFGPCKGHRNTIRGLVKEIKGSGITSDLKAKVHKLCLEFSSGKKGYNPNGNAAQHLRYLDLHLSGKYTPIIRGQVKVLGAHRALFGV